MRPFPLLNATKVLILAMVLAFGAADLSSARDIDQRTIYRRGHHDGNMETRTILSGKNRYRHSDSWRNDGWRNDRWRDADRRYDRRYERRWRAENRRDRRHDFVRDYRRNRDRTPYYDYGSGGNFPSPVPGIGTYAGGISAWRDPGNGIYFSQDNYGGYGYGDVNIDVDIGAYMNGPRVLDVDPETMDRACSYEHGVCVIRRR